MFVHETTLEVRYYETDLMGIVHHSNYVRYFECGRNDALVSLGIPIRDIEEAGVMMPVVKVECNYKYPAKQGDKLRIVSEIRELPRAKVTIFNSIYNENGDLVCNGFVTLGFIHKDTRRPTRAPQFFVDKFAEFFQS